MKSLYEQFGSPTYLFDSHCHLNDSGFDANRTELIDSAKAMGVEKIFDMSIDLATMEKSLEIASKYPEVKPFAGIDPDVCIPGSSVFMNIDFSPNSIEEFRNSIVQNLTKTPNLIAGIGETGMDFHHIALDDSLSTAEKDLVKQSQEALFRMHLELAAEYKLPVSLHSRGAEKKCLAIVKDYECLGIFHSYTGDYQTAKEILDAGWGLGLNGIVTFKNAQSLRDLYKKILGDKRISAPAELYKAGVYIETDAPYLAPEPHRGEKNLPEYIKTIFDFLALSF